MIFSLPVVFVYATLSPYYIIYDKYRLKLVDNPHLKSDKFWRIFNEVPVFILIIVVFLVVTKPF